MCSLGDVDYRGRNGKISTYFLPYTRLIKVKGYNLALVVDGEPLSASLPSNATCLAISPSAGNKAPCWAASSEDACRLA
jgi:hypothetical protein